MALRRKQDNLEAAERLLRQNKVQEGLALLERVTEVRAADLLTLNRICDQLVRHKRIEEAVRHYQKIADEFSRGGFYPKAVAIHKKILRLHPGHIDSLVRLGELYIQQRLPGEARTFLLHAAERSLKAGDYVRAREVYEILVEAEPGDPRHRARLAETRAAEGDTEQAGQELLLLADSLFSGGKPGDAEQTYRRALELLPNAVEPLLGICKSMSEQGRQQEALKLLESRVGQTERPAAVGAELALYLAMDGREDDALERLKDLAPVDLPAGTLMRLFRFYQEGGRIDALWERMDGVFERWIEGGSAPRVEALYARLGTLEQTGHVPALRRLYELTEKSGDRNGMVRAAEELVRAYRARNMVDEAASTLDRLREIAPHSSLLSASAAASPGATPARAPAAPAGAEGQEAAAPQEAVPAVDPEAPAVPLNRNDEEFVAGRLTQAEILEKYGLFDQATEQVREVTAKFPGHVPALERLVTLLRGGTRRDQHQEALVKLALARRAIGDTAGAAAAVTDAERIAELEPEARQLLERVGLLQEARSAAESEAAPPVEGPSGEEPEPAPPEPTAEALAQPEIREEEEGETELREELELVIEPEAPPPGVSTEPDAEAPPAASPSGKRHAVVIDFDDLEEEEPQPEVPLPPRRAKPKEASVAAPPRRPAPRVRVPGDDMLKEIRQKLTGGKPAEARRLIQTLRLLGYASEALDRLDADAGEALASGPSRAEPTAPAEVVPAGTAEEALPAAAPPVAAAPAGEESPLSVPSPQEAPAPVFEPQETAAAAPDVEPAAPVEEPPGHERARAGEPADDDDLSTITAALESELFADDGEALVPEAQSEQSLEDVFSAFKRHVAEEVGSEDFRTHYDLGIAYKEMGLMDEAIGEFEIAVRSQEMNREAAIMLAICHRDRRESGQAVEWYRRAIEAPGGDSESATGLRYDLAEVLLEAGDVEQALQTFRDVLAVDPAFRDVRERVEQLEARLTT